MTKDILAVPGMKQYKLKVMSRTPIHDRTVSRSYLVFYYLSQDHTIQDGSFGPM
jgi:hypothetical protein